MAKRKCEVPLTAVLPPCKRPQSELLVYPRRCAPHTGQESGGKRRRKAELIPAPECERRTHKDRTAASPPPSKKPRIPESPGAAPDFQCQKDEAFQEYNSFHFWRAPLPDVDFSELVDGACDGDRAAMSTGTDVPEEMDN